MDWYLSGQARLTVFPSSHSASCVPTFSSLSSYHHPILSGLACHRQCPSRLTPRNLSYTVHCPIRSSSSSIHCSIIFSLSPFPSPTSLKVPPLSQSLSFLLLPTNKTKTLHQKQFHFFFASKHVTTQRNASIPRVDYLCIYSPEWYLSRTKNEGYWCVFWKRKKRA